MDNMGCWFSIGPDMSAVESATGVEVVDGDHPVCGGVFENVRWGLRRSEVHAVFPGNWAPSVFKAS